MEQKQVKCPKCGVVLDVKNSKGELEKIFNCPKCQTALKVKFPQRKREDPVDAITVPGAHSQEVKTQYGTLNSANTSFATKKKIKAFLEYQGKEYPLQEGINRVGRRATGSEATVQIETDDVYMSRNHAIINCIFSQGRLVKSILKNDRNKNSTFVSYMEGRRPFEVGKDDQVVLEHDCTIKMGDTLVTYLERTEE